MKIKNTKTIDLTVEQVAQAIADYIVASKSEISTDSMEFHFNIKGGNLDTAYDRNQVLDGCTVTIQEEE